MYPPPPQVIVYKFTRKYVVLSENNCLFRFRGLPEYMGIQK